LHNIIFLLFTAAYFYTTKAYKMEAVKCEYLFIYSSLRKGFHQHGFDYITPYFNFICNAKVKGILNNAVWGPVATPTKEGHFITGELYQLKEKNNFSWVFGQLDDYEGGNCTNAWIYWYNGEVQQKRYTSCSI
jgi:gamma-glutamylcyclotransferase (GGCT)/AIG2-like uncharacterized protein YtfP